MILRRRGLAALSLCCIFLLSSCTTVKKVGQVIMDPDTPVGSTAEQPTSITLSILAEPDVNQNESGDPSPIEVQVIYLSEESKLLAADYDLLNGEYDLSEILGKNYIDHQDYTIVPGQYKPLPPIKIDEKSRYIGVIAHYSDANQTEWKKVLRIDGLGHKYRVLVHVRATEIELKKEDE